MIKPFSYFTIDYIWSKTIFSSKKEFYIYDSVLTKDSKIPNLTLDLNGSLPGNRNIDYETLINMWNNGGMFGLYKNYGIVCFK